MFFLTWAICILSLSLPGTWARLCLLGACKVTCADGVSQCNLQFQQCLNDHVGGCVDIVTVTSTTNVPQECISTGVKGTIATTVIQTQADAKVTAYSDVRVSSTSVQVSKVLFIAPCEFLGFGILVFMQALLGL